MVSIVVECICYSVREVLFGRQITLFIEGMNLALLLLQSFMKFVIVDRKYFKSIDMLFTAIRHNEQNLL